MDKFKFDEAARTFETRLEFIRDIFSNKFSRSEIMTSCIQHKLNKTYVNYIQELVESFNNLNKKDPVKVFNKLTKGD